MPQTLEDRLQALEDREAIRNLIAGYGPSADGGDAEGVAALWTEDGTYSVFGFADAHGRAEIATLITSETHTALMDQGCAHALGPVAIALDGDEAVARGHSVVFRHTDTGFEVWRVSANRWQFARGTDGWRVTRRDNALLNGQEAARRLLTPPTARHPS